MTLLRVESTICALIGLICAVLAQGIGPYRERLKDPADVFPVFQDLVKAGEYGTAHLILSPSPARVMAYEEFYVAASSFEAVRRLIASFEVHAVEVEDGADVGRIRICSNEFGVSKYWKLARMGKIWILDSNREDLIGLKDRALSWYRRQVKSADGWHFAYPPDWNYTPVRRNCACKR